jgi:hypothetical protein
LGRFLLGCGGFVPPHTQSLQEEIFDTAGLALRLLIFICFFNVLSSEYPVHTTVQAVPDKYIPDLQRVFPFVHDINSMTSLLAGSKAQGA